VPGVLVKGGGLAISDGGVFSTSAGVDCCCGPSLGQYLRAVRCPCDTPPPNAPAYLLVPPDAVPSGADPWVFMDGQYLVCWSVDPDGPLFDAIPGDSILGQASTFVDCDACCVQTCPPFAFLPSQVTVTVAWTFNGVSATESPPPPSMTWTMNKSLALDGIRGEYLVAPFDCHPQLPYTDDGCSMRWIASLQCGSPQAPNNWRLAFTFESAHATIIQGTPDKQCTPECVPPLCCAGVRFYGVAGIRPVSSLTGQYQITSTTPDVSTVTATVS